MSEPETSIQNNKKKFSKRILNFFKFNLTVVKNFFVRKKKPEPAPSVTPHRKPGLKCPRCQFLIEISIPMLLSGQPIFCNQCYLRLSVDQKKSKDALKSVHQLDLGLKKAEKHKKKGEIN